MKRYLFLFIILIVCATAFAITSRAIEREPQVEHEVSGTVYQWVNTTVPGSRAGWTAELQPAPGTKMYVRAQIDGYRRVMPIVDSLITDSLGNFKVYLKDGKYHIIEQWKTQPLVFPQDSDSIQWDTTCIRMNYLKVDESIEVNGEMDSVRVLLSRNELNRNSCAKRR